MIKLEIQFWWGTKFIKTSYSFMVNGRTSCWDPSLWEWGMLINNSEAEPKIGFSIIRGKDEEEKIILTANKIIIHYSHDAWQDKLILANWYSEVVMHKMVFQTQSHTHAWYIIQSFIIERNLVPLLHIFHYVDVNLSDIKHINVVKGTFHGD